MTDVLTAAVETINLAIDLPIKRFKRGEQILGPDGVRIKVQGSRAIIP